MKFHRSFLPSCFIVAAVCTPLIARTESTTFQVEIPRLLQTLGDSDCRFQRNEKWYDATVARAHLQRKYHWMLQRDLVRSTEQFIEQAASRSSRSGQVYRVDCPGQTQMDSATWFDTQLRHIRSLYRTK
ncbi:MAG: DUF5329 domain-containing protein [Xanthomonadaceae bacterium]|jgi:hypothetical protein|nr:DUF5329 domain-containing protein [Xanthomonadaceae bacterium]